MYKDLTFDKDFSRVYSSKGKSDIHVNGIETWISNNELLSDRKPIVYTGDVQTIKENHEIDLMEYGMLCIRCGRRIFNPPWQYYAKHRDYMLCKECNQLMEQEHSQPSIANKYERWIPTKFRREYNKPQYSDNVHNNFNVLKWD